MKQKMTPDQSFFLQESGTHLFNASQWHYQALADLTASLGEGDKSGTIEWTETDRGYSLLGEYKEEYAKKLARQANWPIRHARGFVRLGIKVYLLAGICNAEAARYNVYRIKSLRSRN